MSKLWLNNYYSLSNWVYKYCRDIKDDPELRKFITSSTHSFLYCKNIEDRPELRKI